MEHDRDSQNSTQSSQLGGASGGGGIDQFKNWLKTADVNQRAQAALTVLRDIGTMPRTDQAKDVFSRALKDEPDALSGIEFLRQTTTETVG